MSEDMGDRGQQRTPPTGAENENDSVPVASEANSRQMTSPPELVERGAPTLDVQGTAGDRMAPSQVARTVAVALLTAVVVLGGSICSGN